MNLRVRGLDPCVHCGFCLQSCPTFLTTGDEADGPRGRILLMQQLATGRLTPDEPRLAWHLDRCLGCRACETVCPSGVAYGSAWEEVRHELAGLRPLPFTVRLVNGIMRDSPVRRVGLALARLVRPVARRFAGGSQLGFAAGMLAATKMPWDRRNGRSASVHPTTHSVVMFTGCIMEGLFGHVHAATRRVLQINGYTVLSAGGQQCCGALHLHAGQHAEAVALARANIEAFAAVPDASSIAVNSAGCGAMLKEYPSLLHGDALESKAIELADRVRDVTELLAERGPLAGAPIEMRVAYDPPCHLLHAQRIVDEPLAVLDSIPGIELTTHAESALCCGSAGSYSLSEPGLSRDVLDRKVEALLAASPDVVATGNPGCIMQIGAGLLATGSRISVVHPVELLDRSYECAGLYDG